jgi:hypothetical protein
VKWALLLLLAFDECGGLLLTEQEVYFTRVDKCGGDVPDMSVPIRSRPACWAAIDALECSEVGTVPGECR